jgi:hypothetical protein
LDDRKVCDPGVHLLCDQKDSFQFRGYVDRMNKYALAGIAALLALVVGGFIALALWDIPAPPETVETKLDDSRFPR